jgi:hypothetical protein
MLDHLPEACKPLNDWAKGRMQSMHDGLCIVPRCIQAFNTWAVPFAEEVECTALNSAIAPLSLSMDCVSSGTRVVAEKAAQAACVARKVVTASLGWAFKTVSLATRQLTTLLQSRQEKYQQIVRNAIESDWNNLDRARERVVMGYILAQPTLESDIFGGAYDEGMREIHTYLWEQREQDRHTHLEYLIDYEQYQIDDAFADAHLKFNEIAEWLAQNGAFIQAVTDVGQSYDTSNPSWTQ